MTGRLVTACVAVAVTVAAACIAACSSPTPGTGFDAPIDSGAASVDSGAGDVDAGPYVPPSFDAGADASPYSFTGSMGGIAVNPHSGSASEGPDASYVNLRFVADVESCAAMNAENFQADTPMAWIIMGPTTDGTPIVVGHTYDLASANIGLEVGMVDPSTCGLDFPGYVTAANGGTGSVRFSELDDTHAAGTFTFTSADAGTMSGVFDIPYCGARDAGPALCTP